MFIFQYCDSIIMDFLHCLPLSFRSNNFVIAKVVALNLFDLFKIGYVDWFIAFFCIASHIDIALSTISNSCRFFTLLKALSTSKENLFAIASQGKNYRDTP